MPIVIPTPVSTPGMEGAVPVPPPPTVTPTHLKTAPVPPPPSTGGFKPHWYLGLGTGVDFPGAEWGTAYTLGGGGKFIFGYSLSNNFSIQMDLNNVYYSATTPNSLGISSIYQAMALPELKYVFDGDNLRPYLLIGGGIGMEMDTYASGSPAGMVNDEFGGGGFQLKLRGDTLLYLECKINFVIYGSGNTTDVPLGAGILIPLK